MEAKPWPKELHTCGQATISKQRCSTAPACLVSRTGLRLGRTTSTTHIAGSRLPDFLGERIAKSQECLGPHVFVASHDSDEQVRLTCLEVLFGSGWVGLEAFMIALTFDPADEVRRLALEALGLLDAASRMPVALRMSEDSDPEIRDKARAMLAEESWQRWRL